MGVWQNSWLHDWEFHYPIRSNQERVLDSHTRFVLWLLNNPICKNTVMCYISCRKHAKKYKHVIN